MPASFKISTLTAYSGTPVGTDLIEISKESGGSYLSRKVTLTQLQSAIGGDTPDVLAISDGDGTYTFYADIAAANAAASSGDTITFFADITETGATEWVLKDGVNYNLNGYTYEMSNSGTLNAVTDNAVAVTCTIFNGIIKRTGGTDNDANSLALHVDSTTTELTLSSVTIESSFGVATRTDGTIRGGRHIGYTKGVYAALITSLLSDAYCYGGTENGLWSYGITNNCYVESDTGVAGRFLSLSEVQNSSFYSASGYGVHLSGCRMLNCSAKSDGTHGGYANTATNIVENCSFYSSAGDGWHNTSSTSMRIMNSSGYSTSGYGMRFNSSTEQNISNCAGYSSANSGIYFSDAGSDEYMSNCHAFSNAASALYALSGRVVNCSIVCDWDNASGHGVECSTVSMVAELSGCTIQTFNASANCIYAPNAKSSYLANNIYGKVATTAVNANVTNSQTNTPDTYGNIQIG